MEEKKTQEGREEGGKGRPMIEIRGLRKQYRYGKIDIHTLQGAIKDWRERRRGRQEDRSGEGRGKKETFYALDGIDLTVRKGETLGIIGKNGAGKSTLLKIISRITAPTEGTVDLYGRVASMLEVGTGFHGDMTGRENIYLNGAILGMTRAEIDAKLDEIIEFSEIGDFIDTPVKRYSSGMFVKLGFSVATHLESEIVIMDEVLAVGDMDFQKKCIGRLLDAARGQDRTVLYVSHNMNTIRQLCDRCIVLDGGRIVFDGDVDRAIAVYLGSEEIMARHIRFGPAHRPNDHLIRMVKKFTLESLTLPEGGEPVWDSGDRIRISLVCTAELPLDRVGLRFELWSQDGQKIGSMLSGNFLDFEKGTCTVTAGLSFAHLASGQYRADLVAFQFGEDGSEYMIDAVYPAMVFQIRTELDETNYLDWHHKYWGAVRLDDMELRK